MTETEARQFVKRLESLCGEYERDCECRIDLQITEKRTGSKNTKFIVIEGISLKIDK